MANPAMRARYLADTIGTASPARLVVLLYDRLTLDLDQAERELRDGSRAAASDLLVHAQEILLELRSSLNVSVWPAAEGLAQLYGYLFTELMQANVHADAERVAAVRPLVSELAETWRDAAMMLASAGQADQPERSGSDRIG